MSQPLILVPGRPLRPGRISGWWDGAVGAPSAYVEALQRAGGREAVLMPVEGTSETEAAALVRRFDGLLLMGGGDVDPARYGEERHAEVLGVSARRDAFELALSRAAVEAGLPVLAVCRGMQVLNVALGGTLHQHIDGDSDVPHRDPEGEGDALHAVRFEPGSRIARALGKERTEVVASHHQALAKLAPRLVATGWAEDDHVEAVEHEEGWIVGVQWHPERSAEADPEQQRLFDALVQHAQN